MMQNYTNNQRHRNQNVEVTYEMNNTVDGIKSRQYLKARMMQNSFISNEGDMSTHASETSFKKMNSSMQIANNPMTDYSYIIQKNNIKPLYQSNNALTPDDILSQSKRSNHHIRIKPFIDRSYDNGKDFDLKGLKNKINYTSKVNQAIEAIQQQNYNQSKNCSNNTNSTKLLNSNQMYYYESDNIFNKTHSEINSNSEDNLIISYDQIKHLPLEEQVSVLFNNNQQLVNKCREQKLIIDELSQRSIKEKDLIETNKQFKDYLIKENEEIGSLNKSYEYVLNTFIEFLNNMKKETYQGEDDEDEIQLIELNQLKQTPLIAQSFLENLKYNGKKRKKSKTKKMKQSKSQLPDQEISEINNYQSPNYYEYHDQSHGNCLPCNLGLNNSNKGYSPVLCSPNRLKYLKRSRTPI